jgi:hypothetical protein
MMLVSGGEFFHHSHEKIIDGKGSQWTTWLPFVRPLFLPTQILRF